MDKICYVKKTIEISAAHQLNLPYKSPCNELHGHNWKIVVCCKCLESEMQNGMVVDFAHVKKQIHDVMDHAYLNEVFDFNPTAENIASWIVDNVKHCYRAEVSESRDNWAACEEM